MCHSSSTQTEVRRLHDEREGGWGGGGVLGGAVVTGSAGVEVTMLAGSAM
jgi:hypothetical protein